LALACEVFDGEAHPQTLIRLGLPPGDDMSQPPTERRPANETTTWTSRAPAQATRASVVNLAVLGDG